MGNTQREAADMKMRIKYLINPKLQLSILAAAVVLSFLQCLMIYGAFSYYFGQLQGDLHEINIVPGTMVYDYVQIQKEKMLSVLLIIGGLVAWLNVILLMIITQKVAGPIYGLTQSLERLLEGKQDHPIKVRKGDFFVEFADLLEQVRRRGLKD